MKFVSALVAIAALASSVSAVLSTCGEGTGAFELTTATYSPNPATVNKEVCVIIIGSLKQAITAGAKLTISTTLATGPIEYTSDLCEALAPDLVCPIPAGTIEIKKCEIVPDWVPTDKPLTIEVKATNADESPLFCFKGPFKFQKQDESR